MKKLLCVLLVILVTTGCYESVPLGSVDPAPGKEVVVEITSVGAARLAQYIGPRAMSLTGNLIAAETDSLKVAVNVVTRDDGEDQFWKGEAVTISRTDIARIAERRLSPLRTSLAVGILAAVGFTVRQVVGNVTGSKGKDGGPPVGQ